MKQSRLQLDRLLVFMAVAETGGIHGRRRSANREVGSTHRLFRSLRSCE